MGISKTKKRQRSRFGEQEVIKCGKLMSVEGLEEWPGWRTVGSHMKVSIYGR